MYELYIKKNGFNFVFIARDKNEKKLLEILDNLRKNGIGGYVEKIYN